MGKRVVVTGIGIVSSIGNNCDEVITSLKENISGIESVPEWSEYGFKTHVAGTIKLPDISTLRQDFGAKARYMDLSSIYSLICAEQAIKDSGLSVEDLKSEKTGCVAGSSFSNSDPFVQAANRIAGRENDLGPFDIARSLSNSIPASFSSYYGIRGRSYSIGSACATSVHNVGHACELIKSGACDVILAGGAEELSPILTCKFDGVGRVMSRLYNDNPTKASRAYDKDRDGFVISGGAGIVVLEDYDRAVKRKAHIYGEITGFGVSSDGYDIIKPDPDGTGCYRCMDEAIKDAGCKPEEIDYINSHGTSTKRGDVVEARSISKLFGDHPVKVSSTKSLTGHGIGATGVQELIYCLLMMKEEFVVASVNIENRDSEFDDINIVMENESCKLNRVLTNSFGFGGTNGSLVVERCDS